MADSVKSGTGVLLQAVDVASTLAPRSAPNGIRFSVYGDTKIADAELQRIVQAVPATMAPALMDRVFYFVPLAIPDGASPANANAGASAPDGARGSGVAELSDPENGRTDPENGRTDPENGRTDTENGRTVIAREALPELFEEAICHRNVPVPATASVPAHEGVFISSRLLRDTFALAFEFFINIGHAFCEYAGIPEAFSTLAWGQALSEVRGETSQDAFEFRTAALAPKGDGGKIDEKARLDFLESAFADALAIYQLSLAVDFDYAELREREYPLLAPAALADRLRLVAQLFPPNQGYDFSIRYRRRG